MHAAIKHPSVANKCSIYSYAITNKKHLCCDWILFYL